MPMVESDRDMFLSAPRAGVCAGVPIGGDLGRLDACLRRYRWWILCGLVVLAAVPRVIHQRQAAQWPLYVKHRLDSLYYHQAATYLVQRDWGLGRGSFHMSPFYTYLLGGTYHVFGVGPHAIRVIQSLLGIGICLLAFALGVLVLSESCGVIAGIAVALYRPLIFYESVITPATVAAFLAIAIVVLCFWSRRRGWGAIAALGACFGLAMITRPNVLLFLPVVIGGLLVDRRYGIWAVRWKKTLLVIGITAAVIAPVTGRNLVRGDSFVLVTDSGGLNFYIGNYYLNQQHRARGFFVPVFGAANATAEFRAFRREAQRRLGKKLTAAETSRYWMRRALADIWAHPLVWLRLEGQKLLMILNDYEIPNTRNYQFSKRLVPLLRLPLPQFGWIMPFALLGLVLALWRWRECYPLAGYLIAYAGAMMLFFVLGHYRLPMVPLAIVSAALGIVCLLGWLAERAYARVCAVALALCLGFAVTFAPLEALRRDFSQDYFQLGYAYHELALKSVRDRSTAPKSLSREALAFLTEAEKAYAAALRINREHISAHKNLGRLYQARKQFRLAVAHFLEIVKIARKRRDEKLERYAKKNVQILLQLQEQQP